MLRHWESTAAMAERGCHDGSEREREREQGHANEASGAAAAVCPLVQASQRTHGGGKRDAWRPRGSSALPRSATMARFKSAIRLIRLTDRATSSYQNS
jgi:hypothetical protein